MKLVERISHALQKTHLTSVRWVMAQDQLVLIRYILRACSAVLLVLVVAVVVLPPAPLL